MDRRLKRRVGVIAAVAALGLGPVDGTMDTHAVAAAATRTAGAGVLSAVSGSAVRTGLAGRAASGARASRSLARRQPRRLRHVSGRTRAKSLARDMLVRRGWAAQYRCLEQLWNHESNWRIHAGGPLGSYGIPQALPGAKMRAAGPRWRSDAGTQISWGLGYIRHRYGGPCGAWRHFQLHNWY